MNRISRLAALLVATLVGTLAMVVVPSVATASPAGTTAGTPLGDLGAATRVDAHTITIAAGRATLRITATTTTTLRVEVAPDGTFTDPDHAPAADPTKPSATMLVDPGAAATGSLSLTDQPGSYRLGTGAANLTITKTRPTMTLRRADGTVLMKESAPLRFSADSTTQSLTPQSGEQFYGAGEQNGAYNRTGTLVQVANSFNWNEGGFNNSQPYYVSTAGYGVFRHTFAPGAYDFGTTAGRVTTTEQERRFDAYYFVGDLKSVIGSYTDLVGKPFMPPVYGLENGDSDCYLHNANRGERHTLDAVDVAKGYTDNGMPNGWMLVNDGYGCGYENLAHTGRGLADHNMAMGLWTENGLDKIVAEGKAGVTVRKLDVAWVGPGYRFALDGCQSAYDGIQASTTARGFVYQPNSWAGAQRCGVLWSGDQYGTWDYIRWQIPTYASSTLSGIAYNTGDVDGIFGGSPETYARDLQWKTFLPTTMTMDGWAGTDKQPFRYGADINAINRKYLLLKERLIPYSYSYSAQANRTGVGQVRPLYLEYPDDPQASSDAAKYEFLSGTDFLVAPVYSDTTVRNGIYLPKGTWVDYWSGRTYTGPTTINGYSAPLDTLPLFVRGGAVVPMWPEGTTSWKTRDTSRLAIDVYPQGTGSFDLYEDDGTTRAHESGASSTQKLSVTAPQQGGGRITVSLGTTRGTYAGQATKRAYDLSIHSPVHPTSVRAGTAVLDEVTSSDALAAATTGWFYDATTGIAHVKTPDVARTASLDVTVIGGAALLAQHDASNGAVSATVPATMTPGTTAQVPVTFRNDTDVTVNDVVVSVASTTPGITATPASTPLRRPVPPGTSATVPVTLTIGAGTAPGHAALSVRATYVARNHAYASTFAAETTVPYASVADAYDSNGVSDADTYADADFDGAGDSFYGEGLAAAGLTAGATVHALGADLTWPDVAASADDNVAANGQVVAVSGRGNALVVLGAGSSLSATGAFTVTYTDGTTTSASTGLPNWCCQLNTTYDATPVAATTGRYTPAGLANTTTDYGVTANSIRLDPAKDVASVTLPSNTTMHVFDIAVGNTALPPPPPAGTTQVSDLTWLSATNGYGPVEKDMSNGEDGAGDGGPLSLDGTTYAKGLGVHAPSTVSYYLGGRCTRFQAQVGVDDEIPDYGSIIFTVLVDGRPKQVSTTMSGSSPSVPLDVDVSGATYLDLQVSAGSSSLSGDHGDWADARVTCSA